MIKSHQEERTEKIEVIDDILCNKCGESCRSVNTGLNFDGLLEVVVTGCFGSVLGDGIEHKFSVCSDCLLELFKSFKIEPKVDETSWIGSSGCNS